MKKDSLLNNLVKEKGNSMFLCGVNEMDIPEIVSAIKNKRPTDITVIDMEIIKEVIIYCKSFNILFFFSNRCFS